MLNSSSDPQIASPQETIDAYRRLADDLENLARNGPECVVPTVMISDWVIAKRAVPVLLGTMSGHPVIRTGKIGFTTEIVYWDQSQNLARTMNRWYRLGRAINQGFNQ